MRCCVFLKRYKVKPTLLQRILQRACDIQPGEVRITLSSFGFVLTLMSAYYMLRPVRDAMASDWTDAELSWLWTITFFISALAVLAYGAAVAKIRFVRVVPSVYGFFALSFVVAIQVIRRTGNPIQSQTSD